ncbi:MAG TPA: hypothetical protein VJV78_12785 [Polyangiales bacterium]|nr:hypothetical protein [Polyangiales bacterium]
MPRLGRWIAHPRAPYFWGVALACVLCIPGLWLGLIADDIVHRGFITEHLAGALPSRAAWWNMFDGRGPVDKLIYYGIQPWWASPHLSVAFLRPLATCSHFLDYLLWPKTPALMHAHNIALYAAIVLLVADLYRRLIGPGLVLWLAVLLYAADDAHVLSTAWLASRNTLLTALFALGSVWCFDRARRSALVWAKWLTPLLLLAAHACSEGAISIWGYYIAYALFLDRAPVHDRVIALAPLAMVSLGWMLFASLLGYGVHGSGAYVDPRIEPLQFLRHASYRLPDLLRVQFGIGNEVSGELPRAARLLVRATAVLVWLPALVYGFRTAWQQPTARFLLSGCLLALVPLCAVGTVSRLLFIAGFGAHGFAAVLLMACRERVRVAFALPLVGHALIALLAMPLGPSFWRHTHQRVLHAMHSLPAGKEIEETVIMLVNTPDFVTSSFVAVYRQQLGGRGPLIMHTLGVCERPVRLTRLDQNAILLQPEGGYLADRTSVLARPRNEPFAKGQLIGLLGAWVGVEELTSDGRPAQVRIAVAGLDSKHYWWMTWDAYKGAYTKLTLPAIGQTKTLYAPPGDVQW